jgi:molybdopterin-guanine dinucleotide biosynthesis protein MobB
MFPIIAVVGASKSGKTTLIEYLISSLSKEGLSIGTIKHVHHPGFSIDVKGKDTWRHSEAGAKMVVCVGPEKITIIKKGETIYQNIEEILNLVKDEKLDLLIIEGFHSLVTKRRDIFKIITTKNEEKLRRTLRVTVDPVLAVTGLFAQKKVVPPRNIGPIIDLYTDREKILDLVKTTVLGM